MLGRMSIKNFQSHKKTSLVFDKGINVIIGQSLSGKTAILRALYWLIYNRPSGMAFNSHFSDNEATEVSVFFSEGYNISHTKSDKSEQYVLSNKKWEKVNKEVPDDVTKIINFGELNIQRQLDKPFMITATPGEISKTINRITKLE